MPKPKRKSAPSERPTRAALAPAPAFVERAPLRESAQVTLSADLEAQDLMNELEFHLEHYSLSRDDLNQLAELGRRAAEQLEEGASRT